MPEIPAAIAVVMLVATCIGFNTARFPVVLEMAAVSEMSSQTSAVVCSESSTESETSRSYTDDPYSNWNGDQEKSADSRRSSWSSYDSGSSSKSKYNSYNSYGSYDNDDDSDEDKSSTEASYGYAYGDDDSSSSDGSSYGYGKDKSSASYGYGYGNDSSSSNNGSSYGYGYGKDKSSEDDESETSKPYSWQDSSHEDSDRYAESDRYDSDNTGSDDYDTYAQSDPYGNNYSTEGWENESADSYGDDTWNDRSNPAPYDEDSYSYGNGSSYENETKIYDGNDRQDRSGGDTYASGSSCDDRDSVTRYGERQEAAAENSSTWSGGAPMTASPAGPYAYGSNSYEDSSAASANVVPNRGSLGLVPVSDQPQAADAWSNGQYGSGQSSPYPAYGGSGSRFQDRSQTSSAPAGFVPLPPVDRTVRGPVLSPSTDGSIPLYPSTETL